MPTLGSSSGHCIKLFLRIEFTDNYCVVVADKCGPNLRSMMIFVHTDSLIDLHFGSGPLSLDAPRP